MNDERQGLPTASPFGRYKLCHASFQLEREAAELGQLAHQAGPAAERGLRIHGRLAGEPGIKLSDDELETAEFLRDRADGERFRFFGEAEVAELKEKRLWLKLNGEPALSGRFDRVLYTQSLALVQDYKTGWREPEEAEQDAQTKVLAVLVALALPTTKEVIVQIISRPYGVKEARYDLAALKAAYNDIASTLKAINEPEPTFSPSPEACRYCPAKLICPAIRKLSMPISKFSLTKLPEDPQGASRLLDEINVLESAFEQIKAFYFNRLLNDPSAKIVGYDLVPNAARREIVSIEAAKSRLAEFLDSSELNAALDLKIGQVEKLFGKKLGLKGKELRERFNAVMGEAIVEKTPAPSLKRIKGESKIRQLEGSVNAL